MNLSNHLQGKHGWSANSYAEFAAKGRRPPKFHLPTKTCPLDDCAWQGLRLDMHLRRSHKMDATSQQYKDIYKKTKQTRKQAARKDTSAATNTTTTCTDREQEEDRQQEHGEEEEEIVAVQEQEEEDQEERDEESDDEERGDGAERESDYEESMSERSTSVEEEEEPGRFSRSYQPPSTLLVLLKAWRAFQLTPDGGSICSKQVDLNCAQISLIADTVCNQPPDIMQLTQSNRTFDRFFKLHMDLRVGDKTKGKSANTLVNYSYSLQAFLSFALKFMSKTLSTKMKESIQQMVDKQKGWRASMKKLRAVQKSEREWEEVEYLITTDDIQAVRASDHARQYDSDCQNANITTPCTTTFLNIRDWLIFELNVQNANRAGLLSNITLQDIKKGRTNKDGLFTVQILHHKTVAVYGGALLTMSSTLHKRILQFIEDVRFHVEQDESLGFLFLTCHGCPLSNNTINKSLKAFIKKTGIVSDQTATHISSTMIRKSVVTNTRNLPSPIKNQLAAHMAHSRRTADRSYTVVDKLDVAARAHHREHPHPSRETTRQTQQLQDTPPPKAFTNTNTSTSTVTVTTTISKQTTTDTPAHEIVHIPTVKTPATTIIHDHINHHQHQHHKRQNSPHAAKHQHHNRHNDHHAA